MASIQIAAIGAGGKTTALKALANQVSDRSVLFATTTHIFPLSPEECRLRLTDPTAEELSVALSSPGIICAGSHAKAGKLGALPPHVLQAGLAAAEVVLYEADGSHRLPLKLHNPTEPVLLPSTDRCLVVAGLSALGCPVGEVVHRFALDPIWRDAPQKITGPEEIFHCILETAGASKLPKDRIRVLLNQLDTVKDPRPVLQLMERLQAEGLDVRGDSLHADASFLYDWVTG